MEEGPLGGTIPPGALRGSLRLTDVEALLRAHGALIRSVDNHHWQISRGDRSGLWMLGDAPIQSGSGLDQAALTRLQLVLRQTGLLREGGGAARVPTPIGAAILWVGQEATRVYWISARCPQCAGSWRCWSDSKGGPAGRPAPQVPQGG